MKKTWFIPALAALALVSCKNPEVSTSPDVRTFGLTGDVKNVYVTLENLEPENVPLGDAHELTLSFDAQGRVTLDPYGNTYEYDDNGLFVRGSGDKTVMQRDAKGRVILYDNTLPEDADWEEYEDIDYEHYIRIERTFDAQGRPDVEDMDGWEWMSQTKYFYEGSQVWPVRELSNSDAEGTIEDVTAEYTYLAFDKKGNWTERTIQLTIKTSFDWDEEAEVEVEEILRREQRVIEYWSGE